MLYNIAWNLLQLHSCTVTVPRVVVSFPLPSPFPLYLHPPLWFLPPPPPLSLTLLHSYPYLFSIPHPPFPPASHPPPHLPSSFLSYHPSSLSTPYPLHPLPASAHLFLPPSESGSARFNAEQMARTVQARIEANRTSQGGSSHGPNIYAREPNRLLSFYVGNLTWVRGQAAWNLRTCATGFVKICAHCVPVKLHFHCNLRVASCKAEHVPICRSNRHTSSASIICLCFVSRFLSLNYTCIP